jgi:hypothetical protein
VSPRLVGKYPKPGFFCFFFSKKKKKKDKKTTRRCVKDDGKSFGCFHVFQVLSCSNCAQISFEWDLRMTGISAGGAAVGDFHRQWLLLLPTFQSGCHSEQSEEPQLIG